MRLERAAFALSLALGMVFSPAGAYAQWQPDGIPVAALNGNQHRPVSAPDSEGGAFLAWFDDRGPYGRQIFAQRLDASGVPAWTPHGIPVRNLPGTNWELAIVADGQGGAILTWYTSPDTTQDNILAQRLDADGNCLWDSNGVAVCRELRRQFDPVIVPDGTGGAIIAWRDERNSFDGDVYAQRMSAAGDRMWDPAGVPICVATGQQLGLAIVASGDGGAIVAWEDYRSGTSSDIYAQRVDDSGAVEWTPEGVPVCRVFGYQFEVAATEDGANGTVLAWLDSRGSPNTAIYSQRLSSAGVALWDTSGVELVVPPTSASDPCAVSDGAGGAIVAWEAFGGGNIFVKAQHVSATGAVSYGPAGMRLTNAAGSEQDARIASDGAGGAIVAWVDGRNGSSSDIYAQRVSAGGLLKWSAAGHPVCTAAQPQNFHSIVASTPGTAIVAWSDFRTGAGYDVYAARPDNSSLVGVAEDRPMTVRVRSLRPNPTPTGAALDFELATAQRVSVEVFDVSGRIVRRVAKEQAFTAGPHTVHWDGTSDRGVPAPAGVYGIRLVGSDFSVTRRVAIVR